MMGNTRIAWCSGALVPKEKAALFKFLSLQAEYLHHLSIYFLVFDSSHIGIRT
jgi:hypothetical protein